MKNAGPVIPLASIGIKPENVVRVHIRVTEKDDRFHAYCAELDGCEVDQPTRGEAITLCVHYLGIIVNAHKNQNKPVPWRTPERDAIEGEEVRKIAVA